MVDSNIGGSQKLIEKSWFTHTKDEVVLVGSKCSDCAKVFFPKKKICPECFEGKLRDIPLSKKGRLHTYTQSVMGPTDIQKPYVIGFIDLPEGIKLFAMIVDCEPWDQVLKIDMEMEMVVGPVKRDTHGNEIIGYMFKPATERGK